MAEEETEIEVEVGIVAESIVYIDGDGSRTCLSDAGFQSGSNNTSLLPPIKLIPQPPACMWLMI